jgi:hypothetical protein
MPVSSHSAGCSESPRSCAPRDVSASSAFMLAVSPLASVPSDSPPFRRDIFPLEAASQDLGKHLRAPQRGTTPACGMPEPLVNPGVAVLEIYEGAGASHCGGGHQPRRAHGSVGTTPSSTKTTGTKNARRRVQRTMIANALSLESTGLHTSAGTTPSKRHGTGTSSFAGGSRTSPGRCAAVLPSTRSESRTFERIDKLSGRRGILVRLRGGHGDEGTAASTARQRRTSFQLRCAPPGRDGCEDLTPGDASLATIRRNERFWLGTRTTATLFRRRLPLATASPSPDFRHHNRLSERGTKRPHPSRDRPVSNHALPWNHPMEPRL